MRINYYLTVSKSKEVIETKYFWYYPNGYTCVDARYLDMNISNASALYELETFFYKLIYLNDNITEGLLIDEGLKMLEKYKRTKGVFISEKDVFEKAEKCAKAEFNKNIVDRIYTTKRVLWKSSVNELYKMNESEKKEYDELKGVKKELYLMNFKAKKKQKEAMVFINKFKSMNTKKKVIETIEELNSKRKSGDKKICIKDVSEKSGLTFKTVKKHYEEYMLNDVGVNGYRVVVNRNELNKEEKIQEIQSVINQMKINGDEINKKAVAEKAGVSRTTVIKHWDKLNK